MRDYCLCEFPIIGSYFMKSKRFSQAVGLALVLTSLLPNVAQSAVGSVTVDWDTFQLSVIDTNLNDGIVPTINWIGQTTLIAKYVDGLGGLPINVTALDWTSSGVDSYSNANLDMQGSFSANTLSATSTLIGPPTGGVIRLERWGALTVTADARIEASVKASVSASIDPAEAALVDRVYAEANLFFGDNAGNAFSPVAYLKADTASLIGFDSATLFTSFNLSAGALAYIYTQPGVVASPARVPLPASIWFMGLSLPVFFWRKLNKKANYS
jgi:hypothetical protein